MNQLPPPQRDEYDVVIANLDDCGQFFIRQTYGPLYSTEFVDYERRSDGRQNPARNCKAFHRRGDVVVAVDGIWTKGKPFEEVVAMMQVLLSAVFKSLDMKYLFSYHRVFHYFITVFLFAAKKVRTTSTCF